MTFEEYLADKKIDSIQFRIKESDLWQKWAALYNEVGPVSFTAQKLYLINPIRRKYRLTNTATVQPPPPSPVKPVFKPKISS